MSKSSAQKAQKKVQLKANDERRFIQKAPPSPKYFSDEEEDGNSKELCQVHDLEKLIEHGIMDHDLQKLRAAKIFTVKGLQMCTKDQLMNLKGISQFKADKLKQACSKILGSRTFASANEICAERAAMFRVPTGCGSLDKDLEGGIESMSITEVYGETSCGKTQLSYTLCVSCQVKRPGYIGGKAIFIDTENTFRPARLRPIARRFGLDEKMVLANVLCVRAFTSDELFELIDCASEKMYQNPGEFRVLIVDSISALLYLEHPQNKEMNKREEKLAVLMSKLKKLCEEFNVAVFITNQVTSEMSALDSQPETKPLGGHIMAHASTTRISLRKGKLDQRIARIMGSPDKPESEAPFAITEGGIR